MNKNPSHRLDYAKLSPLVVRSSTWLTLFVASIAPLAAQESTAVPRLDRRILVPFAELPELMQNNSDRVLMSNQEYEALLKSAETEEVKKAPVDLVLVDAQYEGVLETGIARITGRLILEPLNPGWVQIELPISGVAIRSATLDGQPAKLWRDNDGKIQLLTSGTGRQQLELSMLAPVVISAARQSLSIQLPHQTATRFQLTVSGNVEVKSGATVADRRYDATADQTVFDLLSGSEPMQLVLSLNNRLLKDDQVVVANSVLIHKLTPDSRELHLTTSLDVIHGAVETIRYRVPQGYQVIDVATEMLSQWLIDRQPDGDILTVQLRAPVRDDLVLSVSAAAPADASATWVAPDFRPLDVAGQVSVVGILADVRLRSPRIETTGVIPIDHDFLQSAIPASTFVGQFSPLAVIAAYYAPQSEYSIQMEIEQPAPELSVRSSSRVVFQDQQIELQGGLSVTSAFDSRYSLDLMLPEAWRMAEITGADGTPLPFERFQRGEQSHYHVRLPSRVLSTEPTRVYFTARAVPDDWLNPWQTTELVFPNVDVDGATQHSGTLAVTIAADLSVRPTQTEGLEPLDQAAKQKAAYSGDETPLAYQFKSTPYRLAMAINRLQSAVSARTITAFQIRPTQLLVHAELNYEIRQAKSDTLQFRLPVSTPDSIAIAVHNGRLKDYSSEIAGGDRVWTVLLAEPHIGPVKLLVDYQQPLTESQLASVELNRVAAAAVDYQSSIATVEGDSELDIRIQGNGRPIDIDELTDAVYHPGRYLLGAFSWPTFNGQLSARCTRRPVYELPAAILQRAAAITAIGADGSTQTAARFSLITDQPFLKIGLPEGAELWSVVIDGVPAKPQTVDREFIISLANPAEESSTPTVRDLQLVYQAKTASLGLWQDVAVILPRLTLHTPAGPNTELPLVDLSWRLYLPDGYQIAFSENGFQSNRLDRRPSLLQQFRDWLIWAGGGVDFRVPAIALSQRMAPSSSGPREAGAIRSATIDIDRGPTGIPGGKGKMLADEITFADPTARPDAEVADAAAAREQPSGDAQFGLAQGQPLPTVPKAPVQNSPLAPNDSSWALRGLRSLPIQLTESGNAIDFYSLGSQSELRTRVFDARRIDRLGLVLALIWSAIAFTLARKPAWCRWGFVLLLFAVSLLLPLLGRDYLPLRAWSECTLVAAIAIACLYLAMPILSCLARTIRHLSIPHLPVWLPLGWILFSLPSSQAQEIVQDVDQFRQILQQLQTAPPARLPMDAIIESYDPNRPEFAAQATQLLLPLGHYTRLVELARADQARAVQPSPVDYVMSSAQYSARLSTNDELEVVGRLSIEVLNDRPVTIAMPMERAVLSNATVDGAPARLRFASAESNREKEGGSPELSSSVVLLYLQGAGVKEFDFQVRLPIARQGGWRSVTGRLPVGVTRRFDLTNLDQETEIRVQHDADARLIEAARGEEIATVLGTQGELNLQWKPSTGQSLIDQSLTVASEAIFDVREDGLRLAWRVDLDFRGTQRSSFSLLIPAEYLVERVTGDNVRGWEVSTAADPRRLDVSLLSPATDHETFMVELSEREFAIGDEPRVFDAPYLIVDGAALQNGVVRIRRSPIIELKSLSERAASRVDVDPADCKLDAETLSSAASPLGIENFQCLRFLSTPFQVRLQANRLGQALTANSKTVLRMGQTEATLETQIDYTIGRRPIHSVRFDLPLSVEITSIVAGQNESWTTQPLADRQRVQIAFPKGVRESLRVVIEGNLTDYSGQDQWSIPQIRLSDVATQTGQIAVQVDPALSVTSQDLNRCETILVHQLDNWLNPEQRKWTRLGLRTRGPDYSAQLNFARIPPVVTAESITNVRITPYAIEETILLDFDIQQAGIRQVRFLLPQAMRKARIHAPMTRELTFEPAAAPYSDWVQVRLDLQDEMIGVYRIVVEFDRQLESTNQPVPFPIIQTGTVQQRYATLQNAGRDELKMDESSDAVRLNAQLNQYTELTRKLSGGEVTLAFIAKDGVPAPQLTYNLNRREAIETVAASIEFSQTQMVVDANGAYCAVQNFQVSNRSEQYLDIELPSGAELLTTLVAGEPVKPVAWPEAGDSRRLRIPLVKTPLGDLDYAVQLKYAGQLGDFSRFQEVQFPVVETLNIQVQLSQLQLQLPDSYQWANFSGTMTRVNSQGELQENFLSYKARQIQQLAEQIQSNSYRFGKVTESRARANIVNLQEELAKYDDQQQQLESKLQQQIESNKRALKEVEKDLEAAARDQTRLSLGDNREQIKSLYEIQSASLGRNAVTRGLKNFANAEPAQNQPGTGVGGRDFDESWLLRNELNGRIDEAKQMPADAENAEMDRFKRNEDKTEGAVELLLRGQQANLALNDDTIDFLNPAQMDARRQLEGRANAEFAAQPPAEMGGGGGGGGFGPAGGRRQPATKSPVTGATAAKAGRLASLDVELPSRGTSYYFKSPRGNATVSARAIANRTAANWTGAAVAIAVCLGGLLFLKIGIRVGGKLWGRRVLLALLLIAGLLSITVNVLPVYGLLAVAYVLAVVLETLAKYIRRPRRRSSGMADNAVPAA